MQEHKSNIQRMLGIPVIVAALGYFVDIYDLLLFGIVRLQSLKYFGLSDAELSSTGTSILNWQMTGLLIGGILWGILGDKRGRLSVLFGSILTYSLANIACGFVQDPFIYKILRFIAGVGLAGELGAGITLVSEILPKRLRAIGTSMVAGIGLCGAIVAYFTVKLFSWQHAYFIGGGLGICLLLLRLGVFESGMFKTIKQEAHVQKVNFFAFFSNKKRFFLYIKCIAIGLPTWFVIGILATFANEFGIALGSTTKIEPGLAITWCYVGLSAGDLASGFLSHALHSRKKVVAAMMMIALIGSIVYLFAGINNPTMLYGLCLWMGIGIGYWTSKIQLQFILILMMGFIIKAGAQDSLMNIGYGNNVNVEGKKQSLSMNIFFPNREENKMYPIILMMHGGGFLSGSKESMNSSCRILADSGFIAVTINYRKGCYRGNNPLACDGNVETLELAAYRATQDARAALRYLVAKQTDYAIDTDWIFIGGSSDGPLTALNVVYLDDEFARRKMKSTFKELGSLNDATSKYKSRYSIKGICAMWGDLPDSSLVTSTTAVPAIFFHGKLLAERSRLG